MMTRITQYMCTVIKYELPPLIHIHVESLMFHYMWMLIIVLLLSYDKFGRARNLFVI